MNKAADLSLFSEHFNQGHTQLAYKWIAGDLETPVSAYLKLCHNMENSFLLESVEGGKTLGRYSIIGFQPDTIWSYQLADQSPKTWTDYSESWNIENKDALDSLRDLIASCHIDFIPETLPPMAVPGLYGYMGYDMIRLYENVPDDNGSEIRVPDSILMRPTILVIFDNVKNEICVITPVYDHAKISKKNAEQTYDLAMAEIDKVIGKLHQPIAPEILSPRSDMTDMPEASSNLTREQYHEMVHKAVEYIEAGEIFQVVPSQRFTMDFDLPSIELYRSLRRLNPSPFLFHVQFDSFALVGSSPEILVRVRDDQVTVRPIAGTRKRGKDDAEDRANAEDLLSDEKERAEHLMLLDLGRNDVGRVSKTGSVKVTEQFIIENYSHVMHIVSNVVGELCDDLDIVDALFAGFPAGTVSGAPKIRAMEIIDELEPTRRQFYGGAVGYLSGNGVLDTCIALRTGLVKDGKLYIQAGGGVVADSDAEAEYQESNNKAQALIRAAQNAIENSKT